MLNRFYNQLGMYTIITKLEYLLEKKILIGIIIYKQRKR